ncbi:CheB methylesterase [Arcticibacter tournemirensis]|uniref:protein-glutamate methylesterase n=1 Tax=Arcticibacter tournemirensis TaxID=699437 RepID=A0A5M9H9J0_9SPHI|nr:chemotaxis protein CheB [Arcticibacter tournemirensis]KAA8483586.1 chemotaxis protein CheB [Arcticibacter tournemirensis]TQM51461.1 CheB methylesterase [Arcticibacter tournemirensis]
MEKNSIGRSVGLVVIGGSAGSLDVVLQMLPFLNGGLRFPLIIVLHRKISFDSALTDLFAGKTALIVKEAEEKEELKPGIIYIAPADYHLLVEANHTLSIDYSEKIHYSRPSIDVTFETAADAFGKAAVGILLSGANADGSEGLKVIRSLGGITVVQNPVTAEIPYMPQQALGALAVDYVLDSHQIAGFINKLSDDTAAYSE